MVRIRQGSILGRIGTGIGQGISEQLPKEIERSRLASGLKELGEQKGLTQFQRFAGLAGIPGAANNPQLLKTGGDLLEREAYIDSLKNQYGQGGPQSGNRYIPTEEELNTPVMGEIPTLADAESTAQSYRSFIPPTEQQERQNANANLQKNPARYNYSFDEALAEQKAITARNQEIQKSYQDQEATAVAKEEKVKGALDNEVKRLGLKNVPPVSMQRFEERMLNSMLPKKEGGEGLTQEQAIKKYSGELEQTDRDYQNLGALSSWSPAEFNRIVPSLQKDFAKRGEEQQMMDQLIADQQISPMYAASLAFPLNKSEMKTLNSIPTFQQGTSGIVAPKLNNATYEKLMKEMGTKGSPLSVAYELQDKGYDPRPWMKYLREHKDELTGRQSDHVNKNINTLDLEDMWFRSWRNS